jgi:ABC-2 type transport system permease protein
MLAVLRMELWQRRWAILWWSIAVAALIALVVLIYPLFRDLPKLNHSLTTLPGAAKSLLTDTGDFLSPEGYLSSNLFYMFLPLVFSILTIGLGSSLIAREEDAGTLELLLARPLSRTRFLLGKAFAGLIFLAIVCAVAVATIIICGKITDIGIASVHLAAACAMPMLLALLFGAVAFMLGAAGQKTKVFSAALAAVIAIISYLATSLAGIPHWLTWPAKVLPFNYYHPAALMSGHAHWFYPLIFAAAAALLIYIADMLFFHRDIG